MIKVISKVGRNKEKTIKQSVDKTFPSNRTDFTSCYLESTLFYVEELQIHYILKFFF